MLAVRTEHGQPQAPQDSARSQFTLEPLRTDGPDSLTAQDLPGITRIELCEIEILWDNAFHEATIRRSDNIFACALADGACYDPIPEGCILVHATFHVHFADSPDPREVDIR